MSDLGYDQAMQLRAALMTIAYLFCTAGLLLAVFRHWGNFHEVLMTIIGVAVIVVLINGFPTALVTVADGFKQLREQTTANAPGNAPQPGWANVLQVKFENPQWDEVAGKIEIALCQMFKWIGQIAIWFLDWVQAWAFNGLIAISPVSLGALAVPWTQGIGVNFLLTSFGVAAWHLGIALVDILLAGVALQLFAAFGLGGEVAAGTVISVGLLPIFLGVLVAIVLVALALYLAVPLMLAAVLRGGSPLTTGAKAGIEMTLTAFGLATMAGSRLAASQAASALKGSGLPSEHRSGEEGGDEGTGPAPKPSPLPSGSGFPATARRSRATKPSGETDEQRQSRILAGYSKAGQGRTTRLSQNKPEHRKAGDRRVPGERDNTLT